MRYKFAREGVKVAQGRFFELLSLTWDNEPIPVVWQFGHEVKDLLGRATNLEREEDGWLTAEIEWKRDTIWETVDGVRTGRLDPRPAQAETLVNSGDCELSIYCTDVIAPKSALLIEKAHIRTLSVVVYAAHWEEQ